ncbi:LrgB family protein [Neorhodopirellula lusitana]|uniref:LrgB family protein n=1 Tax=Neorhodopirellula lusitana TaxID=445327 RepID=UPI00384C2A9A
MTNVWQLWTYLSEGPLVWLTLTLMAYLAADRLSVLATRAPLANPVLLAVIMLAVTLWVTATPYET